MDHQNRVSDNPFASSISLLEADFFSGAGDHQQSPGFDLHHDGIPAMAPAAKNTGTSSGGDGSHRKICNRASERDRRKQLNGLYSSLGSLLPETDHTKKLSSAITVSRALKYIPELQKEVDTLEKKKELARANCKLSLDSMSDSTAPIVSATCLDDWDIMVQVSLLSTMVVALPMSKCIKVLENEGLRLISASTTAFQNRAFYSLHLQRTQQTVNTDLSAFYDKLENAIKKKT